MYLDSYWTELALKVGVAGVSAGIGGILGGSVTATVVAAIATEVVDHVLTNSSYAKRGCVVSWNYILGLQDIWPQN